MGVPFLPNSYRSFDKRSMTVGQINFGPVLNDLDRIKNDIRNLKEYNNKQPRPDKYNIIKSIEVGNHLVVEIQYDNCTNYEGKKILVFKNISLLKLMKVNKKMIDPHFSNNKKFISPIARMEPTEEGLEMAIQFVKKIL